MTNKSGINPTEFKVLVKTKPIEETTKGGIIIPDMTKDSQKYSQTEGTIIAVSPLAFSYADPGEWKAANAQKPKEGDRVLYARNAGVHMKGVNDDEEYILLNDKDIVATLEVKND